VEEPSTPFIVLGAEGEVVLGRVAIASECVSIFREKKQ
jgi:hypothetical protein